jgi:hypothetical protein
MRSLGMLSFQARTVLVSEHISPNLWLFRSLRSGARSCLYAAGIFGLERALAITPHFHRHTVRELLGDPWIH